MEWNLSSNSLRIVLPDADKITKVGEFCTALETMQIEAWKTFDPEEVRKVYTDDIVHFDGYPAYVGIDAVVEMSKMMFHNFPKWQMDVGKSYISLDGCVGTWKNWNIFDATHEDPAREFDVLTTKDGKISYWRLLYDPKFGFIKTQTKFLQAYANAWSSGDTKNIKSFYANKTSLNDSLLGVYAGNVSELQQYAESFLTHCPTMAWELLVPFGEAEARNSFRGKYPHPSTGGVFGIHVIDQNGNACMIETFLILTQDDDGKIIDQQVFYNEETLIQCGWVQ